MKFEEWLSQQNGVIEVDCGCVTTEAFYHWMRVAYEAGNSPVVPDGYVMVPKEMTDEIGEAIAMQANCCGGIALDIYDAMLAAAPHDTPALNSLQSVDNVADRWIPVSERMPESNGVYFGWDGKRVLEVNCFFGGFSANQFIHGEITHWMPLPAAPQEVNHG
ncbi:DUF551 domain-containing protein [Klebsiella pneumoniae]